MIDTPLRRLDEHLSQWLGRWPADNGIDVVGWAGRTRPGWDGRVFPLVGVRAPGGAVLSVPPDRERSVRMFTQHVGVLDDPAMWPDLLGGLPGLLDRPDRIVYSGVFRFSTDPAPLPDAGSWVDADEPSVPDWLRPFGHQVLIARDAETGDYLAGVGIKHHDAYGHEIAVGTEPAARGQGLARRLVAQATRRILDEGAIATYQHDPANTASARVAEAAGFPDRGWRSFGMS